MSDTDKNPFKQGNLLQQFHCVEIVWERESENKQGAISHFIDVFGLVFVPVSACVGKLSVNVCI